MGKITALRSRRTAWSLDLYRNTMKNRRQKLFMLRSAISSIALLLLLLHILFPSFEVDAISFGLLIVFILPWLSSMISSAEFPGGWKISFRDFEEINKVIEKEKANAIEKNQSIASIDTIVQDDDPNLRLIALRIELEKRLNKLAASRNLPTDLPLDKTIKILEEKNIFLPNVTDGLKSLVSAANRAAHGATVDSDVGEWLEKNAKYLFSLIDYRAKGGSVLKDEIV